MIFLLQLNGHCEIINLLLNCGAYVNRLNDFGITALMAACLNHYTISGLLNTKPFQDLISNLDFANPKLSKTNFVVNNNNNKNHHLNINDQQTMKKHGNYGMPITDARDPNVKFGKLNMRRQKNNHVMEQIWSGIYAPPGDEISNLKDPVIQNRPDNK